MGFCEVHLDYVPKGFETTEHRCSSWARNSDGLQAIKDMVEEDDSPEVRMFLDLFEGKIEISDEWKRKIEQNLSPTKKQIFARFYTFSY